MIGYVMVGTNDLDRAAAFYDTILAPLGLMQVERVNLRGLRPRDRGRRN